MGKTKVVVHWVDEAKASIEDLSLINEEDRYVSAPTSVKVGNRYHKAIVRFISSDALKLDDEESKLIKELEEQEEERKRQESSDKRGRSSRHKKGTPTGAASSNQVASAVGERLKPTPDQAAKSKELAEAKKAQELAQIKAQATVDAQVMAYLNPDSDVSRNLFGTNNPNSDDDRESVDANDGTSSDEEQQEYSSTSVTNTCCSHCKDLQIAYKHSPLFVRALERFSNFAGKSEGGIQYLEILPVPDDVPKVELSKGSQVWISVSDKNSIKRDGDGDPAKMTRLTLMYLFGRENLEAEQLTAKGTRKGTKGIRKNVLAAIKTFVNRNKQDQYPEFTDVLLNRVINKKKEQLHRAARSTSKSPKSPQKKTVAKGKRVQKGAQSPLKSPVKSPRKNQSIRSPRKSPRKMPLVPDGVRHHTSSPGKVNKSPAKDMSWTVVTRQPAFDYNNSGSASSRFYPSHSGTPMFSPQPQYPSYRPDYEPSQSTNGDFSCGYNSNGGYGGYISSGAYNSNDGPFYTEIGATTH
ncbi:Squamosa promoter-binding-like protein 7 [Frankliniella fusca]|uniref:Squamosa promoter-binding-like protein 7 n=1 Tax=Frankliniella fusca TaxID=407009 RepID=A0AAE1GVH5_9NEOP|nr:Squamosa promoter-binding-like protein 7 [Frankliniella fusca]